MILSTKEALNICKDNGITITSSGLVSAGKIFNFAYKQDSHWKFTMTELMKYILKRQEEPPKNWISIKDAGKRIGLSRKIIYKLVRDYGVEHKYFLSKKMIFVDIKSLLAIIKELHDDQRRTPKDI
jgi:hypothetical protein